jgi:hypothetical protein
LRGENPTTSAESSEFQSKSQILAYSQNILHHYSMKNILFAVSIATLSFIFAGCSTANKIQENNSAAEARTKGCDVIVATITDYENCLNDAPNVQLAQNCKDIYFLTSTTKPAPACETTYSSFIELQNCIEALRSGDEIASCY